MNGFTSYGLVRSIHRCLARPVRINNVPVSQLVALSRPPRSKLLQRGEQVSVRKVGALKLVQTLFYKHEHERKCHSSLR